MVSRSISHYQILRKLGEGGMGEVYLAHDTKLNRVVAIKVLPECFAQEPERLARFQREAQVLASLNHPNIASIYGLEETGPIYALVMEMVEGDTLADRVAKGPLPLDEALPIARQIAEGLEAAHERGIIHRDLKPANVKVTPDGTVKVLDFGLAKVFEGDTQPADLSHSPTLIKGTQAGVILGTAAYMSPEQAKGKVVDKRSDIWAFGCVLFEMLSGQQTFSGETLTDTLAAVVRAEPDWDALPQQTPGAIRRLLRRCLTKDPKQRLRDIGEARVAVETMPELPEEVTAPAEKKPAEVRRRFWFGVAAGVAAAAVLAAALAYLMWPKAVDIPVRRFLLNTKVPASERTFSISPDGGKVLFIEEGKLKVWDLSQLQPRVIEGAGSLVAGGEDSAGPFWSPDGKSIAFVRDGSLFRIPAADGQATVVCRLPGVYRGGAWGTQDDILFATVRGPMYKVSANGGDPTVFIKLNAEVDVDFHQPSFLPDGKTIIYSLHRNEGVDTIEAYQDGRRKVLLRLEGQARNHPQVINEPQYSPTGHIVYRREQGNPGVWAVAFSPSRLEITGEPFLVAANADNPSVAVDGTLIFNIDADFGPGQLAWVNRQGVVEGTIGEPQENMRNPVTSPDGSRIAYAADEKGKSDIWVVDIRTGVRTRLTFSSEDNRSPQWSADGRRIIFDSATRGGGAIGERSADGTGETKILAEKAEEGYISPDGKRLVYTSSGEVRRGLRVLTLDGSAPPRIFLEKPTALTGSRISPDGHYVAYESWEGGRPGIYIRPFPEGEGQWEVAANQATNPRWNPQGGELFYLDNSGPRTRLIVVPVETKGQVTLGQPRELFSFEKVGATRFDFNAMDVSEDGRRFVVVKPLYQSSGQGNIIVAQNWFADFKDKQKR